MKRGRFIIGFVFVVAGLLAAAPVRAQGQGTDTYAAKFICGVQPDDDITHVVDVQAGRYSTKINVHNNTGDLVRFRKKIIPLHGGEKPTNPADKKPLESLT